METGIRFFTAKHCGFCRAAKNVLNGVIEQFGSAIRVTEIDIDENPRAAIEEGILALPVIIIGTWKFVGVPDKEDVMTAILNAFGARSEGSTEGGSKELYQEGRQ
nr:thioredoxin family protein [Candidatus Njordarchaeota archaeon]